MTSYIFSNIAKQFLNSFLHNLQLMVDEEEKFYTNLFIQEIGTGYISPSHPTVVY
jgi:hypothetical protein